MLTVMTYNICSGRNLLREQDIRFAAGVIAAVQPDLYALNEVRAFTQDAPYDQAGALGMLCGYRFVFGKSIDVSGGAYGNAFLTRRPLIGHDVIHIPDAFVPGTPRGEHRTILRCVVDIDGTPVTVLTSHFGLTDGEKKAAVDTAIDCIRSEKNPVVMMGDFNMTPEDATLGPLLETLNDTAARRSEPETFPSGRPDIKIDYILTSGHFRTLSLTSPDTQMSDHRPLIAVLDRGK